MASLTITASQVLLTSGQKILGIAGATITAGQSVYLDTATNTWKLAQADGTAAEAGSDGVGISLNGASSGQPVEVAGPGCIVQLGAGAAAAAGTVYIPGATAGDIAPTADVTTSGYFRTVLAIGKGSTSVKVIGVYAGAAIP
jgi:hypothetical protein